MVPDKLSSSIYGVVRETMLHQKALSIIPIQIVSCETYLIEMSQRACPISISSRVRYFFRIDTHEGQKDRSWSKRGQRNSSDTTKRRAWRFRESNRDARWSNEDREKGGEGVV